MNNLETIYSTYVRLSVLLMLVSMVFDKQYVQSERYLGTGIQVRRRTMVP